MKISVFTSFIVKDIGAEQTQRDFSIYLRIFNVKFDFSGIRTCSSLSTLKSTLLMLYRGRKSLLKTETEQLSDSLFI